MNCRKFFTCLFWASLFFLISFIPSPAYAASASLYLSPASGTYTVSSNFSVSVKVNTDAAINATEGILTFPADKLSIVSVSKTGSILSLWPEEPKFDNALGTAQWSGGLPTPGFSGSDGLLLRITFRVKATGNALISFTQGAVLANDGQGTNILTNLGVANYILQATITPPVETPLGVLPPAPQITSPTHPDSNKWYNNNAPKFTWSLPGGVTHIALLYNKTIDSRPTILYEAPLSEKELPGVKDGVWYFHARFRNSSGWGATTHFRFQVDTEPPQPFSISFPEEEIADNPKPAILFETTDSLSGIDYYRVKIADADFIVVKNASELVLTPLSPGKKTILVQALDKAGNLTIASAELTILPINPPQILDYSKEIKEYESLFVKGITYPQAEAEMFLQDEASQISSQKIKSNEGGLFTLTWEQKLKRGTYKFWLKAIDQRGAQSEPTDTFVTIVKPRSWLKIGLQDIPDVVLIILLILILLLLLASNIYSWYKLSVLRRKVRRDIQKVERTIHGAFDLLRDDAREQISSLEHARTKRELAQGKDRVIRQMRRDADEAEKFIRKELENAEKE